MKCGYLLEQIFVHSSCAKKYCVFFFFVLFFSLQVFPVYFLLIYLFSKGWECVKKYCVLYFTMIPCLSLIYTNIIFFEMLVVYVIVLILKFEVLYMKMVLTLLLNVQYCMLCSCISDEFASPLIIDNIAKLVFPS